MSVLTRCGKTLAFKRSSVAATVHCVVGLFVWFGRCCAMHRVGSMHLNITYVHMHWQNRKGFCLVTHHGCDDRHTIDMMIGLCMLLCCIQQSGESFQGSPASRLLNVLAYCFQIHNSTTRPAIIKAGPGSYA